MNKCNKNKFINPDYYSFVIVQDINERDNIPCKLRQNGMIAVVIEEGYNSYQIKTDIDTNKCDNTSWVEFKLSDTAHNALKDIQGGQPGEYFHLTAEEYNKLQNLEVTDQGVILTENTEYSNIDEVQADFNRVVAEKVSLIDTDLKAETNDRISEDASLALNINIVSNRVTNLEGINTQWNPATRKLGIYNLEDTLLSEISLLSLDNEGTDFRYNATTKALELWNDQDELIDSIPILEFVGNVISQASLNSNTLQLKDVQGIVITSVDFQISNIGGLQNALNALQTNITSEATARTNADLLKVDKTTSAISEPNAMFKYAYIFDEANNTRRMLAGDLGKNIANSTLTSIAGAGFTLGAGYTINTAGQAFNITGLADKSNDATFDKILTRNSAGQSAESSGLQLIKRMPSLLSETQKTNWKTEMNGGWTTASMSIGLISPIVVKRQNANSWLTLKGANLNLNPVSAQVEIMALDDVTVIATVPQNQVQLYENGIDLTFYYNFGNIPLGEYKVRLWNGVAYHLSAITFILTLSVNNVDLTAITWEQLINTPGTTGVLSTNQGSLAYEASRDNKAFESDYTTVAVAKSSILFNANQNFYIKLSCGFINPLHGNDSSARGNDFYGICNGDTGIILGNIGSAFANVIIQPYRTKDSVQIGSYTNTKIDLGVDNLSDSFDFILIRQNNNVIALLGANNQYKIINLGDIASSISIYAAFQNSFRPKTANMSLQEAYTF